MEIWVNFIWAIAIVLPSAAIIWRIDRYFSAKLELERELQSLQMVERQVAIDERRAQIELDALTVDERAQLRRDELLQQAANARADAAIIGATHQHRIEAECLVIAATAEGRAQRAEADALAGPSSDGSVKLELLLAAYAAWWAETALAHTTFDDWFGDRDLSTL